MSTENNFDTELAEACYKVAKNTLWNMKPVDTKCIELLAIKFKK